VLRERIGELEDQFFGTIFLGSGPLFVSNLFASTAIASAILGSPQAQSILRSSGEVCFFAREVTYAFLNIFAIKIAGGGVYWLSLHDCPAHCNPSALDCVFRICMQSGASAHHLEAAVDRDVVSDMDVGS